MIIDKDGIRCYTDENNNIVETGIMNFTEEAKNILQKNHNKIKVIYYESPDCFVDYQLLTEIKNLEILRMDVRHKVFDVTFANDLKKLKGFSSGKFTGSLILPTLKRIGYTWHKKSDISQCKNIDFIWVANCSDMELFISQVAKLKKLYELKFSSLSSSTFPKSDEGTTVKELEFTYCPKLENIEELASNFPDVTKLKFDHCRNIQDYSPLNKLEKLQELYIFESAPITDLSFLENMKNLKLIKILKTKITAKNISFLDLIPKADLLMTGIGKC